MHDQSGPIVTLKPFANPVIKMGEQADEIELLFANLFTQGH